MMSSLSLVEVPGDQQVRTSGRKRKGNTMNVTPEEEKVRKLWISIMTHFPSTMTSILTIFLFNTLESSNKDS